ncbi:MAG: Modification methylase DpnIIB [Anaerolineae bacterium]|nr:Modification methylase DpnIIB [Anaerolineae bacterium]
MAPKFHGLLTKYISYQRGPVTILCGDMRELLWYFLPGSIELVASDPAYETISGGSNGNGKHRRPSGMLAANNGKGGFEHNDVQPEEYAAQLYHVLRDPAHLYWFMNNLGEERTLAAFGAAGFKRHKTLYWAKTHEKSQKPDPNPNRWYMNVVEEILFFRKGTAFAISDPSMLEIFYDPAPRGAARLHPTEKPVSLMRKLIKNSSQPDDVVLDPFCGSGSTLEAAVSTGRQAIGIDIDANYCTIAAKRLDRFLDGCDSRLLSGRQLSFSTGL